MAGGLNKATDRLSRTVGGRRKEITAAYTALAALAVLYVGVQSFYDFSNYNMSMVHYEGGQWFNFSDGDVLMVNYKWQYGNMSYGSQIVLNFFDATDEDADVIDPYIEYVATGRNRVRWNITNSSAYHIGTSNIDCVFADAGGNCTFSGGTPLPDNGVETGFVNMSGNSLLLHLNELSDNISDTSGSGYVGVPSGGVVYGMDGIVDSAIGGDGTDNEFAFGVSSGQMFNSSSGNLTGMYWIKPYPSSLSFMTVLGRDIASTGVLNLLRTESSTRFRPQLYFYGESDSCIKLASADNSIPIDDWTHVVWVYYNHRYIDLYYDGTKNVTYDCGSDIGNLVLSNNVKLFGGVSGVQDFNGSIDEFVVFNRSFTAAEITRIYDNQSAAKGYIDVNYTIADDWASFRFTDSNFTGCETNFMWSNDSKSTWHDTSTTDYVGGTGALWLRLNGTCQSTAGVLYGFGVDFFNDTHDNHLSAWNGTAWEHTELTDIPWFVCTPNQKECAADNQASDQPILNVTNNATSEFYPYIMIDNEVTGIDIMCDDDNTVAGSKLLVKDEFIGIGDSLKAANEYTEIWCWANYSDPDSGMFYNITSEEG